MFLTCLSVTLYGWFCVVTEWVTECCHPRRALEGGLKATGKTLPLQVLWGCPGQRLPVLGTNQHGPHWTELWESSSADFLALHYLENLK